MFVRDEKRFYVLRVLLGLAEAGFFPGIILYMSYWSPARERARAVAWFLIRSDMGVLGPIDRCSRGSAVKSRKVAKFEPSIEGSSLLP